jgi:hypothetical protein
MADHQNFQEKQYAFAAHLRDPAHSPAPPGIEERRLAIYRSLFFNNLYNLLGTMFPVLKTIHSDDHWRFMIRQFMKQHRANTPYFLRLPEEFLAFLQDEYQAGDDDYAFLTELAHYEYAELALSVETADNSAFDGERDGDMLTGVPVKSELAWTYAYYYPVHRISPDFLPEEPSEQPVYLTIYRRSDDEVRFLELNAVTAALLDAIENNDSNKSGEALLHALAATIQFPNVDALLEHGRSVLDELRQLEILIGVRKTV